MQDQISFPLGRASRRLRLDTLVRLRWLAVIGQTTAILYVHYGLGYKVPLAPCLLLISASIWLNITLRIRFPVSHRLSDRFATGLLAYDVLQLGALLYLTGGLDNPFATLFLAPVLISATALPPARTLALGLLVVVCASVLALNHMPLPWEADRGIDLPKLYVAGIWSSILLGVAFTGIYAWRVSAEANQLAEALAAAELVIAREQHLSQLDGLAAAAAHELGTPLATIALVSKEIANAAEPGSPLADDVALLRQEVERCRDILTKLTALNEDEGPLATLSLSQLLEEIVQPQRAAGASVAVRIEGDGPEPVMRRNPSVLYGLGNLLDNAVDFAASRVALDGSWDHERVRIEVRDDGAGFPPDILMRAGDPYVTTRGRARGAAEPRGGRVGLGLGLFLAKTLLDRSGAQVTFTNLGGGQTGARVEIIWNRARFESGAALLGELALEAAAQPPNVRASETT